MSSLGPEQAVYVMSSSCPELGYVLMLLSLVPPLGSGTGLDADRDCGAGVGAGSGLCQGPQHLYCHVHLAQLYRLQLGKLQCTASCCCRCCQLARCSLFHLQDRHSPHPQAPSACYQCLCCCEHLELVRALLPALPVAALLLRPNMLASSLACRRSVWWLSWEVQRPRHMKAAILSSRHRSMRQAPV